ncbi:MAG: tetratricopeptide repeat protein [Candidatus Didemnitutus sp.]|nr:tetratricopeptide repeat protein [Candidatus Didemnitutus sp.]
MSDANKAIFLSYASQDAEAAKRICDALRASGIEVWFDVEGGLETGDEWDAKIRRQIKECVLFLPLISANTQAREEGYFRIEWDLATERARGIASGVPFILPIVIDDTREPNALVPDRFRSVQWTRAPGGELPAATQAKFAKLWSHRAGVARHQAAVASAVSDTPTIPAAPTPPRKTGLWLAVGAAIVAVGAVALVLTRHEDKSAAASKPPATPSVAPVSETKTSAARDWPRSPELKRVITLLDGIEVIPEDFRLAEEIAQRELDKNPGDAEALTVMARVHSMWLLRGWDRSSARYQKAKSTAERALQLAPDEPEALIALAIHLYARGAEAQRAVDLAQRAVDLRPDEPRFHRIRDNCLWILYLPTGSVFLDNAGDVSTPGLLKALAAAQHTVELFPKDAIVRYELSRHYRDIGMWKEFERTTEETLALGKIANALVWKGRARFGLHGDLEGMKAVLDQVPARVRSIERTVFGYFLYSAFTGHTAEGLEALNSFTDSWMIDFDYRGPKALLTGALQELDGKKQLARVQYEVALTELLRGRARNPEDSQSFLNEAWIKHAMGQNDEARAALRTYNEAIERPYAISPLSTWWFQALPANLLIGDRETALTLMREACASRSDGRATIRKRIALDPRLAAFRTDPEIVALLAEPKTETAAAPVSEAAQLAARALAIAEKLSFGREDLGTADDLARRATEKEPDLPKAWGARAWVQAAWIMRNWDLSEKRRQDTQSFANRALSLDPNQPEALYALSYVFRSQGAFDQAESALRKALATAPDNARIARTLCNVIARLGRRDEALQKLTELSKRFPRDPLVRYELAQMYVNYGFVNFQATDIETATRWLDEAVALQPFANGLTMSACIAAAWRDDYAKCRAKLAQLAELPLAERTDDRTIALVMWTNLLDGRYDEVISTAALTAHTTFEDSVLVYAHKQWLLALARERQGKPNLARVEWQNAEPLLRQQAAEAPGNPFRQAGLAITLARVGKREEALALMEKIEPAWREELTRSRPMVLAQFYASLGDAPKAVEYLRLIVDRSVYSTRHILRRDPWWDKIRESAEFKAFLAEPAKVQ